MLEMEEFFGDSIDDLMRSSIEELLGSGSRITPSRGPALELHPVALVLKNPRGRLSRTARGHPLLEVDEPLREGGRAVHVEAGRRHQATGCLLGRVLDTAASVARPLVDRRV